MRTQRAWGLKGEGQGAQGLDSQVGVPWPCSQVSRSQGKKTTYISGDLYLSVPRCPVLQATWLV